MKQLLQSARRLSLQLQRTLKAAPQLWRATSQRFSPAYILDCRDTVTHLAVGMGSITTTQSSFVRRRDTGVVPALGGGAPEYIAQQNDALEVIHPFRKGSITSRDALENFLQILLETHAPSRQWWQRVFPLERPLLYVILPQSASAATRAQWRRAGKQNGVRVRVVDRVTALQAYVELVSEQSAAIYCDIGMHQTILMLPPASTEETVEVVIPTGVEALFAAIEQSLRETHHIAVGRDMLQRIVSEIVTVGAEQGERTQQVRRVTIRGKDTSQYIPSSLTLSSEDIAAEVALWEEEWRQEIATALDADALASAQSSQIVLFGRGSQLKGIEATFPDGWEVQIAPDPETAAVQGVQRSVIQ